MSILRRCVPLLLLLCIPVGLHAQWQLSAPQLLGQINGDGCIHYRDGIVWAGSSQLFMSLDSGKTWSVNQSFPGDFIVSICFHDRNTGLVSTYGQQEGLYLTTDQGATWRMISQSSGVGISFDGTVNDIAVGDVALRSTRDQGANWSSGPLALGIWFVNFIGRPNGSVYTLQGSIKQGSRILASTDFGASWLSRPGALPTDCYAFTIDSCDPNRMYVMHEDFVTRTAFMDNNTSDIYGTTDGGITWTDLISKPIPFFSGSIENGRSAIFAQTMSEGIYRSIDQGKNWKSIGGVANGADTKTLCVINDNIIIAADSFGSIWRTTNSGGDSVIAKPSGTINASPSSLFVADTITECDAPLTRSISLVGFCSSPRVVGTRIVGSDSNHYQVVKEGSGNAGDSIIVAFVGDVGGSHHASLVLDISDGSSDTVSLSGTVKTTPHLTISAKNVTNDTIGGDLYLPITIKSDTRQIQSGTKVLMTLHFDSSQLLYQGSSYSSGGVLPEVGQRIGGRVRIAFEVDSLGAGDSVVGYAKFSMFPLTDSCTTVSIDSVEAQDRGTKICSLFSPNQASALLCSASGCGVRIIASKMRYGHILNFVISPNPSTGSFRIASSVSLMGATIEVSDVLGRQCLSSTADIRRNEPYLIDLGLLASGTYYLRISTDDFTKSLPFLNVR